MILEFIASFSLGFCIGVWLAYGVINEKENNN